MLIISPVGGQGIVSGFRDASALAWRLAVCCRPCFTNYTGFLSGWYAERKQQLERSLAATIENGAFVTEGNPVKIFFRDWYLWLLQLVPSIKHQLEMGPRRYGMIKYEYQQGMPFMPDIGGGGCFPQVYCVPLDAEKAKRRVAFTDDVIFAPQKKGLFQLVVLIDHIAELETTVQSLHDVETLSQQAIRRSETTFVVHDPLSSVTDRCPLPLDSGKVVRIATASEFAQDKLVCEGRPAPLYYDEFRMKKEVDGMTFVILRQDRFVFAACADKRQLDDAARRIDDLLCGEL